jgi:hypothetical protein
MEGLSCCASGFHPGEASRFRGHVRASLCLPTRQWSAMKANPLWRSVYALRYAETLAGLGNVAGPTDAPPATRAEEETWVQEWTRRARETLGRAKEMHDQALKTGADALQDRARRIATAVRDGAKQILTTVQNTGESALDDLRRVLETAKAGAWGWATMNVLLGLGLLWALYEFYRK